MRFKRLESLEKNGQLLDNRTVYNITKTEMEPEDKDKQFVEYVLKSIVNHPEDVHVERTIDEMGVLLSVQVNKTDMGILIGAKGQNVNAIRILLRIVGSKMNARTHLKIIE